MLLLARGTVSRAGVHRSDGQLCLTVRDFVSNFQFVYVPPLAASVDVVLTHPHVATTCRARFACKPAFSRRRGDKAHYVYVVRSLWRKEEAEAVNRWAPLFSCSVFHAMPHCLASPTRYCRCQS